MKAFNLVGQSLNAIGGNIFLKDHHIVEIEFFFAIDFDLAKIRVLDQISEVVFLVELVLVVLIRRRPIPHFNIVSSRNILKMLSTLIEFFNSSNSFLSKKLS